MKLFVDSVRKLLGAGWRMGVSEQQGIKNIVELLGREVVPIQTTQGKCVLKGKVILVTGAAGSIGSELVRQLLDYEPACVLALDTNETGLFDLAEGLRTHPHGMRVCLHIGDITNRRSMEQLLTLRRPHIIFHVAAYKHVPLLEQFPDQAIRTNVLATYYLCRLAEDHKVARFIFISTDKAADPTGVMGATKRLGEMIIQALAEEGDGETCFCAVRFGNVIGSRGSVVPVFTRQIQQGGPVTVTDPQATRYFMTIAEACGLVILVAAVAEQGKLYLLDMGKPVRIIDLALNMLRLQGLNAGKDVHIVYTGLRPGERLHETLVGADEVLVPTTYRKIITIVSNDSLLPLVTVTRWMQLLEQSLQYESNARLRERLFEMVQRQELLISH